MCTVNEQLEQIFNEKKFKSVDLFADRVEFTFDDGTTVEFGVECYDWDAYRLEITIDDLGEWHRLLNVGRTRL